MHAHLATKGNLFAHKAVALSTYGIIFLGTPHQGTRGAEFASILLNIQKITRPVNDALVKHLWRNSEALEQQLSQFVSISKDIVIKFGFETYPTYLGGGFKDLVSFLKMSSRNLWNLDRLLPERPLSFRERWMQNSSPSTRTTWVCLSSRLRKMKISRQYRSICLLWQKQPRSRSPRTGNITDALIVCS